MVEIDGTRSLRVGVRSAIVAAGTGRPSAASARRH